MPGSDQSTLAKSIDLRGLRRRDSLPWCGLQDRIGEQPLNAFSKVARVERRAFDDLVDRAQLGYRERFGHELEGDRAHVDLRARVRERGGEDLVMIECE